MKKWYFITKIVPTYLRKKCSRVESQYKGEKGDKMWRPSFVDSSDREKLLKFEAEG